MFCRGASGVAPYGVIWAAKTGAHTLRVVAADWVGNTAEASVEFTVK
jgi:hypothetical protein